MVRPLRGASRFGHVTVRSRNFFLKETKVLAEWRTSIDEHGSDCGDLPHARGIKVWSVLSKRSLKPLVEAASVVVGDVCVHRPDVKGSKLLSKIFVGKTLFKEFEKHFVFCEIQGVFKKVETNIFEAALGRVDGGVQRYFPQKEDQLYRQL